MGSIVKMVNRGVQIANDDSHGYSQVVRWGEDYDCSSLMYVCAIYAGYGLPTDGTRYTGTMYEHFTAAGFTAIPFYQVGLGGLKKGDILLNVVHHTEMFIGDGQFVGAHCSETGGVTGRIGDQTGREICICDAYDYPWDWVLRPPADKVEPKQVPGEADNDMGLKYSAHVQDLGWCPVVHDGQQAGTTGFALRMEALKVNPPEGLELVFKIHHESLGWKTYKGIVHGNKVTIGTTGKSLRIEDVLIEEVRNTTGKKFEFRVHQQDSGWKSWTPAGYSSGSDGLSIRLEAIQMRLV